MWRETPDSRVRGLKLESDVAMISASKLERPEDGSNGTSSICEAKLEIRKKHLPQLVKTAVVAAFIESNLHSNLSTMVPTIIMIDTCQILIALYCTKNDLLFISDKIKWHEDDKFNLVGITLLWAMINHRY